MMLLEVDNPEVVDSPESPERGIFIEVEPTSYIFRGRASKGEFGSKYAWVCFIQGDDGVATVKGLLALIPFKRRHYDAIDDELRRRGFRERVYRRYRMNGATIEKRRIL